MYKLFWKMICESICGSMPSSLSGLNINQKFNIYTGGGANGKSKFVNLLSKLWEPMLIH